MSSSDSMEVRRCRALIGSCPGPTGPQGPPGYGLIPKYGSFISNIDQTPSSTNPATTPVAITFSSRTEGNVTTIPANTYPASQILIPTTGTYRFLFSAQCISTGSHFIEIWPVINGESLPDSNTRIRLGSSTESCLTIEYIVGFNQYDVLQLYMRGDSVAGKLVYIAGNPNTTPAIPDIPSIILTIHQIA
jgi:hypothetical protein